MGTEGLERGIGLIKSKWKHYAAVFLLLLSMAGCMDYESAVNKTSVPASFGRNPSDTGLITKVSWKVVDYGGPPYFHLYLTLNDEKDYYAGYFWGENFTVGEQADTPANALTAAGAIWTGVGELFCLYQKSETELALMNHGAPYGSQPEEWESYQEIITIPVEKGSKIETGELLYEEKSYIWPQHYPLILYDGFLLGGLDESKTLVPVSEGNLEEYRDMDGEWGFRLFQDGQYLDTLACHRVTLKQLGDIARGAGHSGKNQLPVVELEYRGECFKGLAINDGEPITFGSKIHLAPETEEYGKDVNKILADHGLEGEAVHIREIVKTDLEGDGIEETLITASNIHSTDRLMGRYSFIVLKKSIDSKTELVFLAKQIEHLPMADFADGLISDYELCEILDLDHDGICELLIRENCQEAQFYSVYKLVDDEMQLILGDFGT